jgi:hypothetical protein
MDGYMGYRIGNIVLRMKGYIGRDILYDIRRGPMMMTMNNNEERERKEIERWKVKVFEEEKNWKRKGYVMDGRMDRQTL